MIANPYKGYPSREPGKYLSLFLLMLSTGARPAELVPSRRSTHVALLKKEGDWDDGTVTLRSAKQEAGQRGKISKVPITEPVLKALQETVKQIPGKHVFPEIQSLSHIFDKILHHADVEKIDAVGEKLTPHSFRHTFGTLLAEQGVSAFLIQNVMRHSNPSQTARYVERATIPTVIDISSFLT